MTTCEARDRRSDGRRLRLTPVQAIRKTCYACSAGCTREIRQCPVTDCPLWEYRLGTKPSAGEAKRTPLKAIKAYYRELCGSPARVRAEPLDLPIAPWRLGHRPKDASEAYYTAEDELRWFPWLREQPRQQAGSSHEAQIGEPGADSRLRAGQRAPGAPSRRSTAKRQASSTISAADRTARSRRRG